MKHITPHQSATSLPRAPHDDAHKRSVHYLVMMAIRVVCFGLMIFVQPFGWWTLVFAVGAIFIPYVAVVLANVGEAAKSVPAVPVERELEEQTTPWPTAPRRRVIRVDEKQKPVGAAETPSTDTPSADSRAADEGPEQDGPQQKSPDEEP